MELPLELWKVISQGLTVSDKCSLLTTCSAIKQVIYNDPFWLDFALKNLQRGLTVKEIVAIVLLNADQERIAKSRISKLPNYVRLKFSSSHGKGLFWIIFSNSFKDIEGILTKKKSFPSSVSFGKNSGIAWREWASYEFAFNFVVLFCSPEALNVRQIVF